MKNALVIAAIASSAILAITQGTRLTIASAAEPTVGKPLPVPAAHTISAPTNTAASLIERGKYLVESVGMCTDCHAPRLRTGEFDMTRYLMGTELPFKPTIPMPWVPVAPPIAGLPTLPTDEVAIEFMMTGKRPSGQPVLPPMPAIRLQRPEAEAVVAYLRSLKPAA